MKSKSKMTKDFVWSLVPIALVSYAALLLAAVAFAQAVSFSPATNFLVGGLHPASVAIADLNGDGKPDLATANMFSDSVSILLGTGTGAFGPPTDFAVGAQPMSVAIADLNGDGKPDLVAANFLGSTVSILLGTGTGGFGAATYFPAGIRPISVAIGDLNADGKPDLATANSGFVDDVSILLGDGTGAFGAPTNFVAGASPSFVAIGDLNADGKPDLAVTNAFATSNNVSILLGTGTGAFLPATNFAVGTGPQSVAIGDLNGDSKPDLAVANEVSHNVSILLGTGTGAFLPATNFAVGTIALSVKIADLNCDGKPDLAVTNGNAAVSILLGDGTGGFGAATDFSVGTHGGSSVAIGDLNGDGKPDLAVTNNHGNTVSILLGSAGECTPCIAPPSGLVSWWPGDGGNANDIVGDNNGTLVGATIDPAGMVHQAFSFDGVNDFVAAPNSASLNPSGSFSIDAWVYPRSNGFQTIVGKWGDTGDQTNQRSYVLVNTTTGALNFGISDAAHQVDGAFHTLQTPAGALTLNAWNFVAVVYDQSTGTRRIFVNGSQQATRTDPPITVLNSVARFGIGADLTSSTTSTAHFDGLIDEVEFFNRALSASEIQAIFNAGSAGKCKCVPPPSGLVGWWPGDNHPNDIRNGNHGMLVGGVSYAPGKVNQAFSFPSLSSTGSDRVSLTSAPSANTFTIETWVFANQHGPSAYRTIYAENSRGFWLKSGKLNWWQGGDRFVGNTTVLLDGWHHIALTYSQGTFTGYLNGVADGTSFFPGESLPTGTGLGIGGHSGFAAEDFDGLIDELGVYDRALDPAEIQAIFNAGSGGKCLPQSCPPTITCPANVTRSTDPGQCLAFVNYTVSATASCSITTVACSPSSNSVFPKGTTTVNCTVSDASGNSSSCSFTVTVNDTQAPTVTCPSNVTVNTSPNQCSAAVNYLAPTATDNCPGVGTPTCSHSSGSPFPKGTTTVTCTATDASGNTGSSSFTVTVIPPKLTALSPAKVWIGLKTSDDVGTKFDLLAEVLKNGTVVGTGQLNGVPGGSSGFNNAVLNTIMLALSSLPVDICAGDALAFKLSVRVAANSGHSSGTARLWYSGKFIDTGANRDAGSRFNATIGGGTSDYFLRTGVLNTTAGTSKTFIDVPVNRNVGGNPFKPFGIWSITF